MIVGRVKKIACNVCNLETNHELKAIHQSIQDEYDKKTGYPEFHEEINYLFWICRGCDTATLENAYTCDGMHYENGDTIWDSTYFPERQNVKRHRKYFKHLENELEKVYVEAVLCFNVNARLACGLCLRTLLEGICVGLGVTDACSYGLAGKLKILENEKHLPKNIIEGLTIFKIIGDDAAHRRLATSIRELELGLDVIEDLLNFLYETKYELDLKVKKLKQHRNSIASSQNII